jgi:hypothetical protein
LAAVLPLVRLKDCWSSGTASHVGHRRRHLVLHDPHTRVRQVDNQRELRQLRSVSASRSAPAPLSRGTRGRPATTRAGGLPPGRIRTRCRGLLSQLQHHLTAERGRDTQQRLELQVRGTTGFDLGDRRLRDAKATSEFRLWWTETTRRPVALRLLPGAPARVLRSDRSTDPTGVESWGNARSVTTPRKTRAAGGRASASDVRSVGRPAAGYQRDPAKTATA